MKYYVTFRGKCSGRVYYAEFDNGKEANIFLICLRICIVKFRFYYDNIRFKNKIIDSYYCEFYYYDVKHVIDTVSELKDLLGTNL